MTTTVEIVKWILENRRGAAFPYTEDELHRILNKAANENALLVVKEDGKAIGVILCEWKEPKILFVHDILTTQKGVVKHMMNYFMLHFPKHTIQGLHRSGRTRQFNNPQKLTDKL